MKPFTPENEQAVQIVAERLGAELSAIMSMARAFNIPNEAVESKLNEFLGMARTHLEQMFKEDAINYILAEVRRVYEENEKGKANLQ